MQVCDLALGRKFTARDAGTQTVRARAISERRMDAMPATVFRRYPALWAGFMHFGRQGAGPHSCRKQENLL